MKLRLSAFGALSRQSAPASKCFVNRSIKGKPEIMQESCCAASSVKTSNAAKYSLRQDLSQDIRVSLLKCMYSQKKKADAIRPSLIITVHSSISVQPMSPALLNCPKTKKWSCP